MKKVILAVIATIFVIITSNANTTVNDKTGIISGQIVNQQTSEPVPFANVAVINSDNSKIVTGTMTDEKGYFKLENIPFGKYHIQISFIGYEQQIIQNVSVNNESLRVNLKTIPIKETTTELDEVNVVEERLKGEEKVDRTVFTLNDNIRKSANSGLDVLKYIPSVTVDFQENVTLEGESDIQYYIDGRKQSKEYVAQLKPEQINKVEIITNPGVKYDADISGVINIVLVKNKSFGLNGMFLVPAALPDKLMLNPRANLEYGNKKIRVFASGRMHWERFKATQDIFTEIEMPNNDIFTYNKFSEGFMSWRSNYVNYGVDWFVNKNTTLSLLGEWTFSKGTDNDQFTTNHEFTNDVLNKYYETEWDKSSSTDNHYLSLFIKHNLPKEGNILTAEAYMYLSNFDETSNYNDTYYKGDEFTIIDNMLKRSEITANSSQSLVFKSDYTQFFGKIKNDMGIRVSNKTVNSLFTNNWSSDISNNKEKQGFDYIENRQAAYYSASGKIKNFSWQTGVRAEYSSYTFNDNSKVSYGIILPQFSLNQKLKSGSLKLSFRRRIYRPSPSKLTPFETWQDSLHVFTGNPDLKPAIENRLEFVFAKNFGSNYIAPKLYARFTENGFQDLSTVLDNGITQISQANIGRKLEYGIGVNSALMLFKRLRINAGVAVFNRLIGVEEGFSLKNAEYEKLSYRLNITNIFILPKEFNFITMLQYNSPNISYQRVHKRDLLFLVGMEKQFSKKASLSIYYNPFINKFTFNEVETRTKGYYEHYKPVLYVNQLIGIEFTYRFSTGKKVNKLNRNPDYEKDNNGGLF